MTRTVWRGPMTALLHKLRLDAVRAVAPTCVDANQDSMAALAAVKGMGSALAKNMLIERGQAAYADWNDLLVRVRGINQRSAQRFSDAGLVVNGQRFDGDAKTTTTA